MKGRPSLVLNQREDLVQYKFLLQHESDIQVALGIDIREALALLLELLPELQRVEEGSDLRRQKCLEASRQVTFH